MASPLTLDEHDAQLRAHKRAALEVPLAQRDPDPHVANVLRLVAAAYPAGLEPADPVEVVRWLVGVFQRRGIDLDLLARATEQDVATVISVAYCDQEGTC